MLPLVRHVLIPEPVAGWEGEVNMLTGQARSWSWFSPGSGREDPRTRSWRGAGLAQPQGDQGVRVRVGGPPQDQELEEFEAAQATGRCVSVRAGTPVLWCLNHAAFCLGTSPHLFDNEGTETQRRASEWPVGCRPCWKPLENPGQNVLTLEAAEGSRFSS